MRKIKVSPYEKINEQYEQIALEIHEGELVDVYANMKGENKNV